jgi:hypothetical protein
LRSRNPRKFGATKRVVEVSWEQADRGSAMSAHLVTALDDYGAAEYDPFVDFSRRHGK